VRRRISFNVWAILIAFLAIWGAYYFFGPSREQARDVYYYPEFVQLMESQEIQKVTLTGTEIKAVLTDGSTVKTRAPADAEVTNRLIEHNIVLDVKKAQESTGFLASFGPFIMFAVVLWLVFMYMRGMQGGQAMFNFGKGKFKNYHPGPHSITFGDVAGIDEEKYELQEVVDFLRDPKKYIRIGARVPKGVLLAGPAGTGKTLLARAVAGEAGVSFFSVSGSDFVEMFVGVGASRIRDLFEKAQQNAPCIIFIDEIDAVGRHRGAGLGGGHDEKEQTLNQLLVAMDGFAVNEGIVVLAATNRPDILDPALLRPGRFDRQVVINRPDVRGREEILKIHTRNKPLAKNISIESIARRTPGFTGADLENLVNEAALLTARKNNRKISMSELEESVDRVMVGVEKRSRVISKFEKKIVAFHEAGHALVAHLLPHTDPVHKVSVVPRGVSGGHTQVLPELDRRYTTRSELLDKICMLLAGRVAEEITLNDISTGSQSDLDQATTIARKMVVEHGMSEELGPVSLGRSQEVFLGKDLVKERDFSEETARTIDRAVKDIIDECYQKARQTITENIDKLNLLAESLQEKESLYAQDIERIVGNSRKCIGI
jgi:cell division protease FtsH